MTLTYVLILASIYNGFALTAEFSSKQACINAAEAMISELHPKNKTPEDRYWLREKNRVNYICVPGR